jgi:hypothetical protein
VVSKHSNTAYRFSSPSNVSHQQKKGGELSLFYVDLNQVTSQTSGLKAKPSGEESFRGEIAPFDSLKVPVPKVKKTTTFTVIISNGNGLSMVTPVVKAKGWNVYGDNYVSYGSCATITWAYNSSGKNFKSVSPFADVSSQPGKKKQPDAAKNVKEDIQASFDLLERNTSLTFIETDDYINADIRIGWENLGKRGASGVGDTSGGIILNTASSWTTDKAAGFKSHRGYAGRSWLITHEIMHTLGFTHTLDKGSVMSPANIGQTKFTQNDLDGLKAVYGACG